MKRRLEMELDIATDLSPVELASKVAPLVREAIEAVIVMDAESISKSNTLKLITLSRNPLAELTILKTCNCSAVIATASKGIEDRNILFQG